MTYINHVYGFNKRAIRQLLFEQTVKRNLVKQHLKKAQQLDERLKEITQELSALKNQDLHAEQPDNLLLECFP